MRTVLGWAAATALLALSASFEARAATIAPGVYLEDLTTADVSAALHAGKTTIGLEAHAQGVIRARNHGCRDSGRRHT